VWQEDSVFLRTNTLQKSKQRQSPSEFSKVAQNVVQPILVKTNSELLLWKKVAYKLVYFCIKTCQE
jgi:hypothetical protein